MLHIFFTISVRRLSYEEGDYSFSVSGGYFDEKLLFFIKSETHRPDFMVLIKRKCIVISLEGNLCT